MSSKSVRWNKTSGMHEGTTDDEAGTSDPSGKRGRHLVRVLSVYGKNRLGRP